MKTEIRSKTAKGAELLPTGIEKSFLSIAQDNISLKKALLYMATLLFFSVAFFLCVIYLKPAEAYFVSSSGFITSLGREGRSGPEIERFAQLALRDLYEYEPWTAQAKIEAFKIWATAALLQKLGADSLSPRAWRLFIAESAIAETGSGKEFSVALTGIRLMGSADEEALKQSRVRLTLKITATSRKEANPYGLAVDEITEESLEAH